MYVCIYVYTLYLNEYIIELRYLWGYSSGEAKPKHCLLHLALRYRLILLFASTLILRTYIYTYIFMYVWMYVEDAAVLFNAEDSNAFEKIFNMFMHVASIVWNHMKSHVLYYLTHCASISEAQTTDWFRKGLVLQIFMIASK